MTVQDYNPSPVELRDIFEIATALQAAETIENPNVYGIDRLIIPDRALDRSGEYALEQMSENSNLSPLVRLAGAAWVVIFCSSKGSPVQNNALGLMERSFAKVSTQQQASFIRQATPFLQMKGISFP